MTENTIINWKYSSRVQVPKNCTAVPLGGGGRPRCCQADVFIPHTPLQVVSCATAALRASELDYVCAFQILQFSLSCPAPGHKALTQPGGDSTTCLKLLPVGTNKSDFSYSVLTQKDLPYRHSSSSSFNTQTNWTTKSFLMLLNV